LTIEAAGDEDAETDRGEGGSDSMRVGIAGTGPVGLGCAALLDASGHKPVLWPPRGAPDAGSTRMIETVGLFSHRCAVPVAADVAAMAGMDVIIVCVRSNGHRAVFEALAPVLRNGQTVIIASHASLGALYLSRLIAELGLDVPVVAWATTLTGGPLIEGRVHVRLLRGELDVATLPAGRIDHGLALSRALFQPAFRPSRNMLSIALSNLNPPIHMANAVLNFTRIEKGEVWANYGCITEGVGRLIEALDGERLAIAAAFGVTVRSAREHYIKSFPDLVPGSVADLSAQVDRQRKGTSPGPASPDTRYVTEDLPFGIHPVSQLGQLAERPTPLHKAGLVLLGAVYGRDFAAENDLLPKVGLARMDRSMLLDIVETGWTGQNLSRFNAAR